MFVGGYSRSGTSLLQALLCAGANAHPIPGEVVWLRGIVETYWRSLDLWDAHGRDYFDDRDDLRRHTAGVVGDFLARTAARLGGPDRLVLKHPPMTPLLPMLHDLVPEARFVVMLRDPRDIVASALAAGRAGALEFAGFDAARIAQDVRRSYAACLRAPVPAFQEATLYIRYEGLVRRPRLQLDRLHDFTGIDLSGIDPETWRMPEGAAIDGSKAPGAPFHAAGYGRPLSGARIGAWRESLSAADAAEVARICAPLVALCEGGDEPVVVRPGPAGTV